VGTTPSEVLAGNPAYRAKVVGVRVNGESWDLDRPIYSDSILEFLTLESEASGLQSTSTRREAADRVFSRYAFVRTSSEEFCARKADEIELEERRKS
jgi:hypothetical protein